MSIMHHSWKKCFFLAYLLAFFNVFGGLTQSTGNGSPSITATVDKKKILIGEHLNLTIEVISPSPQLLILPDIDTIPHFEILFKSDPERSGNIVRQNYRLTSFDSGHWVIPAFTIERRYSSDTIHMDVVFSDFDPTQDYHDIKDIVNVEADNPTDWIWWFVIGAIVIVGVAIWLMVRGKKPLKKNVPEIDAYQEAMQRLDLLKRSNLPDRQLFSEAVDVFRLYVFRKKGILSLQKTTDDLVLQLKDSHMQTTNFSELVQALRLADFVKFAKFQPTEADRTKTINTVRESITMLEETNG